MVDSPRGQPRVAVVGTGLIGGSILLRLHEAGLDVVGWDPDRATRADGRERGVPFPDDLGEAVRDRDVVFLCGPLPSLPETLLTVAKHAGDGCVLTDVGSTKGAVAAFAVAHGLTDRFVPGHPMAGTERSGLTAAVPALFEGAAWVLCPAVEGIGPFRMLSGLIVDAFAARVVPMSPAVHDSVVALSSHVPHLLAGSLAGAVAGADVRDAVLGLAAGSFRDGTRVAGTPARRTADMLFDNREQVLRQLGQVSAFLDGLASALHSQDIDALVALFQRARDLRTALLDRDLVAHRREFPAGGDHRAEVAYLMQLGADGGYLTGCRVDGDLVGYTGHLPEPVDAT
ncbi:prephenate dehydrogenase/arogenate dehydrogenase family protein [Micromonospora peucetia]|uniref:Prephenate dehydrogenase n=1 Tax=Micromonospora peucetia TaxID=47871 RepID=A0A1C6VCN3_9ACTN|nr:prephenate dehydrogenase/arogenate dehydrogenase family protein [Micromonospora peucetia]WSA30092.1 prephenate dehydrogenase/arogenate dehydrogenase family protein [Micromonospora peucetia]SCL64098.1 prephenate dehydrogenase [Micromonospora peucetia]